MAVHPGIPSPHHTVTDSSCNAQQTIAPLEMRPPVAELSARSQLKVCPHATPRALLRFSAVRLLPFTLLKLRALHVCRLRHGPPTHPRGHQKRRPPTLFPSSPPHNALRRKSPPIGSKLSDRCVQRRNPPWTLLVLSCMAATHGRNAWLQRMAATHGRSACLKRMAAAQGICSHAISAILLHGEGKIGKASP